MGLCIYQALTLLLFSPPQLFKMTVPHLLTAPFSYIQMSALNLERNGVLRNVGSGQMAGHDKWAVFRIAL